jgi:hypothetical protein
MYTVRDHAKSKNKTHVFEIIVMWFILTCREKSTAKAVQYCFEGNYRNAPNVCQDTMGKALKDFWRLLKQHTKDIKNSFENAQRLLKALSETLKETLSPDWICIL